MSIFLTTVAVCALYLGVSLAWPHAGRALLGVTYLATSLFNFAVTSRNPEGILQYGIAHSFMPFYAELLRDFAVPHAMFLIVAIGVAWEALIGVFVLSGANTARVGLLGAIALNVVIAPLSPEVAAGNALLAIAAASLLRFRFDEGAFASLGQPPRHAF